MPTHNQSLTTALLSFNRSGLQQWPLAGGTLDFVVCAVDDWFCVVPGGFITEYFEVLREYSHRVNDQLFQSSSLIANFTENHQTAVIVTPGCTKKKKLFF